MGGGGAFQKEESKAGLGLGLGPVKVGLTIHISQEGLSDSKQIQRRFVFTFVTKNKKSKNIIKKKNKK